MKTIKEWYGTEISTPSGSEYCEGETPRDILGDEFDRWATARDCDEERGILWHCQRTRGAIGLIHFSPGFVICNCGEQEDGAYATREQAEEAIRESDAE